MITFILKQLSDCEREKHAISQQIRITLETGGG